MAGADLSRVALDVGAEGEEPLTLPSGLGPLAVWMRAHRPALVVIDPVVAFLDGDLNPHRDADVRRALRPLAELAAETGAAVVVVMHFNKAQGSQPLYRLSGSIGFAGAARSMLVFGRRPDAEDADPARLLAVAKSSYAALAPSVELAMSVQPGAAHPSVAWRGEVAGMSATDLLRPGADAETRSAREEAEDFLRGELEGGDWHPSPEVRDAARREGITDKPLRAARETLGVQVRREGSGRNGSLRSEWSLPLLVPGGEGTSNGGTSKKPHGEGDASTFGVTRAPYPNEGTSNWSEEDLSRWEALAAEGRTGTLFGADEHRDPS